MAGGETAGHPMLAETIVLIHFVVVLFITAGLPLIYLGAALGRTWVRGTAMEVRDPTMTIDLFVKSILALGASNKQLAAIIARR